MTGASEVVGDDVATVGVGVDMEVVVVLTSAGVVVSTTTVVMGGSVGAEVTE